MAALTWREISAPQMSTRDLGLAGVSIADAFRNMGQVFIDRETRLRSDATNNALSTVLANQDRNAKLDLAGLDSRVDKAALARAFNDHVTGLVTRGKNQEELAGMEALAKYGTALNMFRAGRMDGSFGGSWEDFGQLKGLDVADQGFGRAGATLTDLDDIIDKRIDNLGEAETRTETALSNRAREADAAAGRRVQMAELGMRREEFNARMRDQRERDQLEKFGVGIQDDMKRLSGEFIKRNIGGEEAWKRWEANLDKNGSKFGWANKMSDEQRAMAKGVFLQQFGRQTPDLEVYMSRNPVLVDGRKASSFNDISALVSRGKQNIDLDLTARENALRTSKPGFWAAANIVKGGDKYEATPQELQELYDEKVSWYSPEPFGKPFYGRDDVIKRYDPRVVKYALTEMDNNNAIGMFDKGRLRTNLELAQKALLGADPEKLRAELEAAVYAPARQEKAALDSMLELGRLRTAADGQMSPGVSHAIRQRLEKQRKSRGQ